jgi:hypothetical protein
MRESEFLATNHENGFVEFVAPRRQERIRALLKAPSNRKKLIAMLPHFSDFDSRWLVHIEPSDHNALRILQLLRDRNAPDMCYVISENYKIDGTSVELATALKDTIGFGFGTVISCIPGELIYYESEDCGHRVILSRVQPMMK